MRALVYHSEGKKTWEERRTPVIIEHTDAIVKILQTTMFVSGLQVTKGDFTKSLIGMIVGHEGVGIIEEVGDAVSKFKKGDHVIISNLTTCGKCKNCIAGKASLCENGGMILGNKIDGTQAEYVRIPYADNSLNRVINDEDKVELITLMDVLPWTFKTKLKLW